MKTNLLNLSAFKIGIYNFTARIFVATVLLFSACTDSENSDNLTTDANLIEQIEVASKITLSKTDLPSATNAAFDSDLADSFVETVELASGLGFKVSLFTDNVAREEAKSSVYFSLEGRQLNDQNKRRLKMRNKCFEFVFPVDFIMPDNTSITLNSKDDWSLLRDWYQANLTIKERPELVFPIDITLEDGTVQTIIDVDELRAVKDSCKKNKDKRKCFKLVLPVSFTMPDATQITVSKRADFRLIREWHKANPDIKEKGSLNFPVDIEYKDGTTASIADETAYKAAKESCKD